EHRAGRVPDDELRDAADEEPADDAATVRADDDEVDLLAARDVHDRLAGRSIPDQEPDIHATSAPAGDDVLGRELALEAQVIEALRDAVRMRLARLDRGHHEDVRTEVVREIEGLGARAQGRG